MSARKFKRADRMLLAGREICEVRFDASLGFVVLSESDEACPFCGEPIETNEEIGVGGHVENVQAICSDAEACGFSQSPHDGQLSLPEMWVQLNLEE